MEFTKIKWDLEKVQIAWIVRPISGEEHDHTLRSFDGRRGIVVTCLKKLEQTNAPLVLNTPHMREDTDGTGGAGFMPGEWLGLIESAERAAEAYIEGKRAQKDLFVDA